MINDDGFKWIHMEAVVLTWTLSWDWCEGYGKIKKTINH